MCVTLTNFYPFLEAFKLNTKMKKSLENIEFTRDFVSFDFCLAIISLRIGNIGISMVFDAFV